MTPRGRQYYDPEIQTTRFVPGSHDLSRIEVFPVGQESTARLPQEIGKWATRLVDGAGHVVEQGPSDFQQDRALFLAQQKWPDLETYVLGSEIEDSTWEGTGPSPRLWQQGRTEHDQFFTPAIGPEEPTPESAAPAVHVMQVQQPGVYIRLDDVFLLLEEYARQYDGNNNPSAALGLREAAAAIKEAF